MTTTTMTSKACRLTRIARRQQRRANGDVFFALLTICAGLGNLGMLLTL